MDLGKLSFLVVEVDAGCAEATWAWLDDQDGVESIVEEEDLNRPGVIRFLTYAVGAQELLDLLDRRTGLESALARGGWSDAVLDWRAGTILREDWAESWKKHWKTIQISDRLWLVPAWDDIPEPAKRAEAVVRLDPGLGFGTGAHFTTRYCLESVSRHVLPGTPVLDLGTGSGILTVAAVLLGAAHPVVGVEFDQLALEAARKNAELNRVEEGCLWLAEDLEKWAGPQEAVDLVLANLYSRLLMNLMPKLGEWVRVGGRLVISGLEGEQGPSVRDAFLSHGNWGLHDEQVSGEWTGLEFVRLR